jgi:hypothetical protein
MGWAGLHSSAPPAPGPSRAPRRLIVGFLRKVQFGVRIFGNFGEVQTGATTTTARKIVEQFVDSASHRN